MFRFRLNPSSGSSEVVLRQVTKMASFNSTSLLKSFGFVAVCQFIPVCVCVLGAPYCTYRHKQEWTDTWLQNRTILTKMLI